MKILTFKKSLRRRICASSATKSQMVSMTTPVGDLIK
jgi:hypothetical protein